jgi:UDP-2,3-diacylglucosamine pyrophosphatase LpxH
MKKHRLNDLILHGDNCTKKCLETHFREFKENLYTLNEVLSMLQRRKEQVNKNYRLSSFTKENLRRDIDRTHKIIKQMRKKEQEPLIQRLVLKMRNIKTKKKDL